MLARLPSPHASNLEAGVDDALHELCGLTGHLFYTLGHFREGSTFLYRSLSLLPAGHSLRVRILQALSMILEGQAHYGEAELFVREARSEAARLEMVADEIVALYNLSHIQVKLGDYTAGRSTLTTGLALCERLGSVELTRILTGAMAQNHHETGNLEEALHWYAKARTLLAQRPFDGIAAGTNAAMAELEVARRNGPAALQLVQPSCDYYEQSGQLPALAWALRNRGLAWLAAGQPRQAAKSLLRAWSLYSELGSQDGLVIAAEGMALVAAALGAGPDAGRLWGSAQRRRREIDLPLSPMSRLSHHWLLLPAQEQLGAQDWALALQSGERLTEADVATLVAAIAQKTGG
jgi:tetratricopeptide (TPR) repeat protein